MPEVKQEVSDLDFRAKLNQASMGRRLKGYRDLGWASGRIFGLRFDKMVLRSPEIDRKSSSRCF